MAGKTNLKLLVAGVVLSVLLGNPALAPAKEEGQSASKTFRAHVLKTLNLRPDKARIYLQIEEKYDRVRQEAVERINKSMQQLEKLLAGKNPDAAKVKELTSTIESDQDILVNTYKARRDEAMALLTPVQQGEYQLVTWKWQQKLLSKYGKHKTGQQDQGKKVKAP